MFAHLCDTPTDLCAHRSQHRKAASLAMKERTTRGQPLMGNVVDRLLGKIQAQAGAAGSFLTARRK
jgi:hypothetical protein